MSLPQDNYMLLSIVNMRLRDQFISLDDFCASEDISRQEIEKRLATIGYKYEKSVNQFR